MNHKCQSTNCTNGGRNKDFNITCIYGKCAIIQNFHTFRNSKHEFITFNIQIVKSVLPNNFKRSLFRNIAIFTYLNKFFSILAQKAIISRGKNIVFLIHNNGFRFAAKKHPRIHIKCSNLFWNKQSSEMGFPFSSAFSTQVMTPSSIVNL